MDRRTGRKIVGITPARAGKTRNSIRSMDVMRDHPRACGKDFMMSQKNSLKLGSPPRVRERLTSDHPMLDEERITPARAGKTLDINANWILNQDHPRACGKDTS